MNNASIVQFLAFKIIYLTLSFYSTTPTYCQKNVQRLKLYSTRAQKEVNCIPPLKEFPG
jgi:hypothetical protein